MKKLTVIFVALIFLVSACQPLIQTGGTFRTALPVDPLAIDPANTTETAGMGVAQQLFDGLVKYNPKTLAIEPAVAASWTVSKDATVYTFKLRKKTRFHNGEEVTANSFKKAADFIANPENQAQAASILEPIKGFQEMQQKEVGELKGVQAVGKYTLKITLSQPSADFLSILASVVFSPLPKAAKYPGFAKHPVGNGPFSFVAWKRNKEIVLQRFAGFYGQKAILKKAIFRIYNDENVALRDYKAGNLEDVSLPPNQVNIIAADYVLSQNIKKINLLSTYSYGFNLKKKPWDNKNLRLAVAFALDRDSIIKKSQPEGTNKATSFTPASVPGNDETLTDFQYEPKKVKELIRKAGYKNIADVAPLTITYATGGRNDKVAQVVQNQLEKAGFRTKIQGLEFGTFLDKMQGGELTFFQVKWVSDPNFNSSLEPLFSSTGAFNIFGYSNKQVDSSLSKAKKMLNSRERIRIYKQAEKKILADTVVIPLFYDTANYLVKPYVKDYIRSAYDEPALEKIWMIK